MRFSRVTLSVLATLASVAAALSVPAHADQRAVVATGLGMTAGQSVAPNGDVAVTSYTNGTVTVFRDGSQIAEYGGFLRPHDVAFDSRGVMYVAQFGRDLGPSRIGRVDTQGHIDLNWQSGFVGLGGIAVNADDSVWAADADGSALYRLGPDGGRQSVAGNWPGVHGLRFGDDGALYVCAYGSGQILRRDPSGSVSVWASGLAHPVALLTDGRGGLYVAEQSIGTVVRIAANGQRSEVLSGLTYPTGLSNSFGDLWVSTWAQSQSIVALATEVRRMPGTNRWYEYLAGGFEFDAMVRDASAMAFRGMPAHLVTVTSAAEHEFVLGLAADRPYPVGARDIGPGDGASRRWAWVTGPEAGRIFTTCKDPQWSPPNSGCVNTPGEFSAWEPGGEPTGGGEFLAFVGYAGRRGWTDCTATNCFGGFTGAVIEYETTAQHARAPSAPREVAALGSDGGISVTWVAPEDQGSPPVSGYRVLLQPGGHECSTVELRCSFDSLENDVTYYASVIAHNDVGHSPPAVVSATPRQAVVPLTNVDPLGVRHLPGEGSWYLSIDAPLDWNTASAAAASMRFLGVRGELATIGNEAENAFVAGLAADNAWIGGSTQGTGYTRWAPMEPSGDGPCVLTNFTRNSTWQHLSGQGFWNDESCANEHAYVVEFRNVPDLPSAVATSGPTTVVDGLVSPRGLNLTSDAALVVADWGGQAIVVRNPDGSTRRYADPIPMPHSAVMLEDGSLLAGHWGHTGLTKVSAAGAVSTIGFPFTVSDIKLDGDRLLVTSPTLWTRSYTLDLSEFVEVAPASCHLYAARASSDSVVVGAIGSSAGGPACTLPNGLARSRSGNGAQPLPFTGSSVSSPEGVAVDWAGRVFVADTYAGQVVVREPSGEQHVFASGLTQPFDVRIDPRGYLLVSTERGVVQFGAPAVAHDAGDSPVSLPEAPRITSVNVHGRTVQATWERPGDDGGADSLTYAVWLTDVATGTEVLGCVTTSLHCDSEATAPGRLEVTVEAANAAGTSPRRPSPKVLVPAGTYPYPMDAKSDSQGNMYVPVSDNAGRDSHFERVAPDGSRTRILDVDFHWWPDNVSLALTPDDRYMYFTDQGYEPFGCGYRLVRVDLSTMSQETVPTGLCAPKDVVIDRDGTIILHSGGGRQGIPDQWWRFSASMELIGETTRDEHRRVWLLNHEDAVGNTLSFDGNYVVTPRRWIVDVLAEVPRPAAPLGVVAVAGDGAAEVAWSLGAGPAIDSYSVVASPGGASCWAAGDENSCTVEGLDNRQRYTFVVRAWNTSGPSDPSEPSAAVLPLAAGFQVWVDRAMALRGDEIVVSVGNAPEGARVVVTVSGSRRIVLEADADGYAETVVTVNRSGRVSVLAKSGRLTARASIAVVRASVAMPRVRAGRPVVFVVSAALPEASVWVELSDGTAVSGVTDGNGKCRLELYLPFVGDADYWIAVGDIVVKTGTVRTY